MQQTHHLQTLLLSMQHNTYLLGPQNLHLNTPTTVTTKNTGPALSTHATTPQPSSKQIRTHLNHLHPAHHNTKPEPSKQLQTPFTHNPQQTTTHKIPPEQATHSTFHHKHKLRQPTSKEQTTQDTENQCKWHPKQNCRTTTTSHPRK